MPSFLFETKGQTTAALFIRAYAPFISWASILLGKTVPSPQRQQLVPAWFVLRPLCLENRKSFRVQHLHLKKYSLTYIFVSSGRFELLVWNDILLFFCLCVCLFGGRSCGLVFKTFSTISTGNLSGQIHRTYSSSFRETSFALLQRITGAYENPTLPRAGLETSCTSAEHTLDILQMEVRVETCLSCMNR